MTDKISPITPWCPPEHSVAAQYKLMNAWRARVGAEVADGFPRYLGQPMVATQEFHDVLNAKVQDMLRRLGPHVVSPSQSHRHPDPDRESWPHLGPATVLAMDLAVVESPSPRGWDLAWVEVQSFTSVLSTLLTIQQAQADLWPELASRHAWLTPSLESTPFEARVANLRRFMAPWENTVLLEYDAHNRASFFDLNLTSRFLDIPIVDPSMLRRKGSELFAETDSGEQRVGGVLNRLVPYQITPEEWSRYQAEWYPATTPWFSHPQWYSRLSKQVLCHLDLPAHERCVPIEQWEELGMAPEHLVIKAIESLGGKEVILGPSREDIQKVLAAHPTSGPTPWLAQAKFRQLPLAWHDEFPIHGELRAMIALDAMGAAHPLGGWIRMFYGDAGGGVTSADNKPLPKAGLSPLYIG